MHFVIVFLSIFGSLFAIHPEIERARDLSGVPPAHVSSYWDASRELEQDFIIIGAGIVGLSAAIEVKTERPDARVLVLERGTLPIGASSRNAGFACIGSFTELLMDIEEMGQFQAILQMQQRWEGLQILRKKMGDDKIGFAMTGNYELISFEREHLLERMEEINQILFPWFGAAVFSRVDEKIEEFGFAKEHAAAMVLNRFEGLLDSGMLMEALRIKATQLGVTIRYGSLAKRPIETSSAVFVDVLSGDTTTTFSAKALAVCINAFTSELLPEITITPGRAQVLVTAPLKEKVRFDAPVHMGQGFWFFRPMPGNRILLGGGRNLNFLGETTKEMQTTADIMGPLKKILETIIVPYEDPVIERVWSGIMGFSSDHLPCVQKAPSFEHVVIGFGCNGMGIARGYHTGQKTAMLLMECCQ